MTMKREKYIPAPTDTSREKLPEELMELVEVMAKMFMRCGRNLVCPKGGLTERDGTTRRRLIPVLCLMRNYPK